jgi:hypothetical protein
MHSVSRVSPYPCRSRRHKGTRTYRTAAFAAAISHIRVAVLTLACFVTPAIQAASWDRTAHIAYVSAAAPVSDDTANDALDYAIAAWTARIDVQLQRTGASTTAGYNKGTIVIRWLDAMDMIQAGNDILGAAATKRWLYKTSGHIAGAEISLRRDNKRLQDSACLRHVLVHELGHALGLAHLEEETSVMHADLASCHHTLTADDIAAAPYPQHICHAELLPGFDIYIPVINIGDKSWSARLAYGEGHWTVTESRAITPQPGCNDSYLDADTLVLDKVWSQEHVWQAELENVDDQWRLKYAR